MNLETFEPKVFIMSMEEEPLNQPTTTIQTEKKSKEKPREKEETKASLDMAKLDKFLDNEKINNSNEPWGKLDKTTKIKKLTFFAETYRTANQLNEEEYRHLIAFFNDCLDKKRIQRVKDVVYDKETGEIKSIPALTHNKHTNHFTLKNMDNRATTSKGLTVPKKTKTAKNCPI